MNAEHAGLGLGRRLGQVLPGRTVVADLPDVSFRRVAKDEGMIAIDLEQCANRTRLGETDLPPPCAFAGLALPRGSLVGGEPLAVKRAGGVEPRSRAGSRRF